MPESYLENALEKLARQLAAFDEASLMDLWGKYAEIVGQFEPTRRWEEAVLIFGFIQSVRMKNQLFNYSLAASRRAGTAGASPEAGGRRPVPGVEAGPGLLDLTAPEPRRGGSVGQVRKPKAGKVIPLRRGKH